MKVFAFVTHATLFAVTATVAARIQFTAKEGPTPISEVIVPSLERFGIYFLLGSVISLLLRKRKPSILSHLLMALAGVLVSAYVFPGLAPWIWRLE